MDKCKAHAGCTTNQFAKMVQCMGSLLTPQYKAKDIVPFPCPGVNLTIVGPALRATSIVAILQAPDGEDVVKASFVRVYNTYIHHDSQLCIGKYKAHT